MRYAREGGARMSTEPTPENLRASAAVSPRRRDAALMLAAADRIEKLEAALRATSYAGDLLGGDSDD